MHFVDQGWCQVDLMRAPPQRASRRVGCAEAPSSAAPAASFPNLAGPHVHAFTPRVRALLQCARIQKRMRISSLAELINVSAKSLRDVEDGVTFPSSQMLKALQSLLEIDLLPKGEDDHREDDGCASETLH